MNRIDLFLWVIMSRLPKYLKTSEVCFNDHRMKKYLAIFILLIGAQSLAAQDHKSQDDSMIRASRARLNEFIASHDVSGMARYWLRDYVRITGNSNVLISKDSAVALWTRTFKQQPTIYYVSTPVEISISEDGLSAWESGTWVGMNTKSKGGNYAANWSKQDNIWKLQTEMYVTLSHY